MFENMKQILIYVTNYNINKHSEVISFSNISSIEKLDNNITNVENKYFDDNLTNTEEFTLKNNLNETDTNLLSSNNYIMEEMLNNTTKNENMNNNNDVCNTKTLIKEDSLLINEEIKTQSSINITKTLGPFETTGSSLDLSNFKKYRKAPNPSESLKKPVKRLDATARKTVRKFKNKIFDSEFQINPKLIFEAKDDPKLNLKKK